MFSDSFLGDRANRMKIVHFADLHLGVETYGRVNPVSGLSTRLEDFLKALDQVVDYSLKNKIDLVLFCGDAYKSREPTQTQQREFARRIHHLSTNGIPVFLLVGNHDLPNAVGRATTTEIFDTLAVSNVYVSNKPQVFHIPTVSGVIQIASLPWLRRSALLAREEMRNLNFEQINQKLQQALTQRIGELAVQLNPSFPSILAAHVWVVGAELGSERVMTIGQEHTLLKGNVAQPAFDYIALGHIHKHQVLSKNPPVVYAGSMERVDFGEEKDEKGFYVVEIDDAKNGGKRQVSYEFHPLAGRRFLTIEVSIESDDIDPTAFVLKTIAGQEEAVKDAIVRLNLSLPAEVTGRLRDGDIREALKGAYFFSITKDIWRERRLRLGDVIVEELRPLDALKKWLADRKVSEERAKVLMEYGEKLIERKEKGQG